MWLQGSCFCTVPWCTVNGAQGTWWATVQQKTTREIKMERSWRGIACLQRPHREFQDSTDRETGPRLTPLLEQVEKLRVLKLMPDWSIQTKKSWVFKRKAQEEEDTIDHKGCQGSHIGNLYLFMTLGLLHRACTCMRGPCRPLGQTKCMPRQWYHGANHSYS